VAGPAGRDLRPAFAKRRESTHHPEADRIVRQLAEGRAPWAIPWPCVYEFFSVVTHPRIWRDAASSPDEAWRQIDAWTASPSVSLLGEPEEFLGVLERFVRHPRVRGPVVHDARLAALCLVHGVEELLSADRDFALFPELPTRNPFGAGSA